MTSNSRIPHLLAPYIDNLPKDSLILITNTLETSANWLTIRYLCGVFNSDATKHGRASSSLDQATRNVTNNAPAPDLGVVLVSWMRDWEFWKTESRKAGVSRDNIVRTGCRVHVLMSGTDRVSIWHHSHEKSGLYLWMGSLVLIPLKRIKLDLRNMSPRLYRLQLHGRSEELQIHSGSLPTLRQ